MRGCRAGGGAGARGRAAALRGRGALREAAQHVSRQVGVGRGRGGRLPGKLAVHVAADRGEAASGVGGGIQLTPCDLLERPRVEHHEGAEHRKHVFLLRQGHKARLPEGVRVQADGQAELVKLGHARRVHWKCVGGKRFLLHLMGEEV